MADLRPAPSWLVERPIAHRGYHDLAHDRAENSMSAFAAAVERGFAIECDLQMSVTGEPVVFHDADLRRLTGREGFVRDHAPAQLATFELLETTDTIKPLRDHLELVAGRVPVILELKELTGKDAGFVTAIAEALSGYDGPVTVMSFDHDLCRQFAGTLPGLPRGLTAEGGPDSAAIHEQAMRDFDLNFVSYHVDDLPHPFVDRMREAGLPVITWTVRTPRQIALTKNHADQMTFEGFDPR